MVILFLSRKLCNLFEGTILCAGDLVERGLDGDAVIEFLRDESIPCITANVEQIRFRNQWKIAMSPWSHFGYSESVIGIECMNPPSNDQLT